MDVYPFSQLPVYFHMAVYISVHYFDPVNKVLVVLLVSLMALQLLD